MVKFLLKVVIFSLPIALFFAFPVSIFLLGRENVSLKEVVTQQVTKPETIYGNAYSNEGLFYYKSLLTQTKQAKVVVIGTSRSLGFRQEFFKEPHFFVNAGMAGRYVKDVEYFVNSLSTSTDMVLFIVLDQDLLFQDPAKISSLHEGGTAFFGENIHLPLASSRGVYLDYFVRKKFSLETLLKSREEYPHIGVTALIDGNGFRSDGSYRYAKERNDVGRRVRVAAQIKASIRQTDGDAKQVSETERQYVLSNLETLKEVLLTAREKSITVVGIIPPLPTPIRDSLVGQKNSYTTAFTATIDNTPDTHLKELFKKNSTALFDISDITLYKGVDQEFIDPVHATDLLYAKALLYISSQDRGLSVLFDITRLKNMITKREGDFLRE